MIRTLLKKQMAQVFSWLFMDNKKKTRRTGKGLITFLLLYAALFGYLCVMIFMLARFLCEALVPLGLGWFYFAVMALLSLLLGVIGSVFNTYASLYLAKDNDLLLSMPIPPRYILFSRLCGVYATGLFYELWVMVPALIAWFLYGEVTVLGAIFSLLLPFLLSFFVLSLSCLLGLAVAFVSTRVKHKAPVVTAVALLFLGVYFYAYFKIYSAIGELLAMAGEIAEAAKGIIYPFYQMGLAATGKPLAMLIFTGIVLGILIPVYLLLSHSFLSLATTNKGAAKAVYRAKQARKASPNGALLRKELRRFFTSPTYLLNCGLGLFMMPIAAVMLLIFKDDLIALTTLLGALLQGDDITPLILAATGCTMLSTVDISAPSVSLEGKHVWIAQTLPVHSWQILCAKLSAHVLLCAPFLALLAACVLIAVPVSLPFYFLLPLVWVLFLCFSALGGLCLNLKFPNLSWTNETVPVKQSMSVTVTLLGGWAAVIALGALYVPLYGILSPALYLALVCVLLAGASVALLCWLRARGTRIFERLSA